MDYMDCRTVAVEDFRTRMGSVETVAVVHKDIEAVVVDVIVVFVDKDAVVVDLVDWDWEISDIDAMYSAVCFQMVVVQKFDLDQQEGGYYSDN